MSNTYAQTQIQKVQIALYEEVNLHPVRQRRSPPVTCVPFQSHLSIFKHVHIYSSVTHKW